MSYPIGTKKNQDIYVRCWECGDSTQRPWIAHCAVNLDRGIYHCHKCQQSGKIPDWKFLELCSEYGYVADVEKVFQEFEGYSSHYDYDARFTLLRSRLIQAHRVWEMRTPDGEVVGYHKRREGTKDFVNEGQRGLGYVGDELVSLSPLRVVEGVYDVVIENSVCVFGLLTEASLAPLLPYRLILCPDSDVVREEGKLCLFCRTVEQLLARGFCIESVEVLPRGEDPGDAYPHRGTFYTPYSFLRKAKEKLERVKG